jgi:hypothetical protein
MYSAVIPNEQNCWMFTFSTPDIPNGVHTFTIYIKTPEEKQVSTTHLDCMSQQTMTGSLCSIFNSLFTNDTIIQHSTASVTDTIVI